MQIRTIFSALAVAAFATAVQAQNDVRFDITKFQVEGNTLLPQAQVTELVAPFAGKQRVYGDVQKALEALENAYRKAGYGTVQVFVPEQELSAGVVKLVVTESVIGKITLSGNKHFDSANIFNTLPGLVEGKAPNMRLISENIQLANENPVKQIEVTLGVAEEAGKVNAGINVSDEDPSRFIVTADNTGTPSTGRHRIGLAYQHANLFNADHILTLAITGSPDLPDTPSVNRAPGSETAREMAVASMAYRLPLYSIGDAIDFAYGKSNSNSPVPTAGVTGAATGPGIVGKGEVYALRWNHYLPRLGEYTSKVIVGYDLKDMIVENCVPAGNCAAVTTQKNRIQPVSFTYAGQRMQPGSLLDYNIGVAFGDQQDMLPTNLGANNIPSFSAYRLNTSYLQVLKSDWALRYNFSGQYAPANHRGSLQVGLPAVEQFGVTGANMVRGFFERTVTGDSGYFMNFEAYTPEMANEFNAPGSLKFLGFIDWGQGFVYTGVSNTPPLITDAGSTGIGLRYSYAKEATFRFDIAYVFAAGTPNANASGSGTRVGTGDSQVATGDFRGHFNLQYIF
jgi:hemolysin activation/secretion protein